MARLKSPKAKGSNYEREVAEWLSKRLENWLARCRRALLSGGGRSTGGADLDNTPYIHTELKRTEKMSPYAYIEQAEEAISKGDDVTLMPVVISRRNGMPTERSLVVLRLHDFARLYEAFLDGQDRLRQPPSPP